MTPKESLRWEVLRQQEEDWEEVKPRALVGVMLKISLGLLGLVVYTLVDRWVRW